MSTKNNKIEKRRLSRLFRKVTRKDFVKYLGKHDGIMATILENRELAKLGASILVSRELCMNIDQGWGSYENENRPNKHRRCAFGHL